MYSNFHLRKRRKEYFLVLFCINACVIYYLCTTTFFYDNENWYFDSLSPFPVDASCDELRYPSSSCWQSYKNCLLLKNECHKDRIQYAYIPPKYNELTVQEKQILILTTESTLGNMDIVNGTAIFKNCPVKKCSLNTLNSHTDVIPDAIIYKDTYVELDIPLKSRQIRMFFSQESPYNVPKFQKPSIINWTATYREDSDIPAPYNEWHYHDNVHGNYGGCEYPGTRCYQPNQRKFPAEECGPAYNRILDCTEYLPGNLVKIGNGRERIHDKTTINYARNKTKMVAWFASNCNANNERLEYAKELKKYISVDIFGECGDIQCDKLKNDKECFEELRKYKFYLSFEDSNCIDYVSDNFYKTALQYDAIPIVMGAPMASYEKFAPEYSYIHVDQFEDAEQLARYLNQLDLNEKMYNTFFWWKNLGSLKNTFFCRLCSMLHSEYTEKSYKDINVWWRTKGTCTKLSWNKEFLLR